MKIKFRKATDKDAANILLMEKSFSSKTYHAYTNIDEITSNYLRKGNAFLILDVKDNPVGFISYEMRGTSQAYINDLTVMYEYQNKGIGSKAIGFMMERLKDTKRIELVTHPKNIPAVKLYLKFGFEIEGWKDNYYGDGEPRLILVKSKVK